MQEVKQLLPPGPAFYPKEDLSEHPMGFFVSELIREQIFLLFHEEIPYSCTVEVVRYEEREEIDLITADIIVNRKSQKGMLIGKGGCKGGCSHVHCRNMSCIANNNVQSVIEASLPRPLSMNWIRAQRTIRDDITSQVTEFLKEF